MKQITLRLLEEFHRPVIRLDEFHGLKALIDTGAVYPIWMAGAKTIERIGAQKKLNNIEFGGITGMTYGSLYELPVFRIGSLIFPKMSIVVHQSSFPVPIILPATMFNNLIFEINNKTHRLNITVPDDESISRNLKIRSEDGHLYILCESIP